MSDNWRNFEYFRCRECRTTWRVWCVGAYDYSQPGPSYNESLCERCGEDLDNQAEEESA